MGSRSSLGDPRAHSRGEERTNHESSELPHHLHRTIAAGGSVMLPPAFVVRRAYRRSVVTVHNGCLIKTEKDGHFTVRPNRNREKH